MPEVIAVDLTWIASLHYNLQMARRNVCNAELGTYDLGKSDMLLASMRQLDLVIQSLNKVVSNPKKYTLTI
jgi:hypothetical protein